MNFGPFGTGGEPCPHVCDVDLSVCMWIVVGTPTRHLETVGEHDNIASCTDAGLDKSHDMSWTVTVREASHAHPHA